jgi:isopenicillin N synthase-like dioxygenase
MVNHETPDFGVIPVVDVSAAVAGKDLAEVAALLGRASRGVGFVQVIGHGIDPQLFHAVYDAAQQVWAHSDEQLDTWLSPTGHPFRGVSYGANDSGERIWQRLQNCRIDSAEEARSLGYEERWLDFFGGNVHPDLPGLSEAIERCFAEGRRLGALLMSLFARDMGLPAVFFEPSFSRDVSYFAVQDYPAMSQPAPSPFRIPEHSDSGALTMLHQRGEYAALRVRAAGELVEIPVVDDAIIINTGDLMARWTNDSWPATGHAVVDGPVGLARASIAMHYLPNADVTVAPLAAVGDERSSEYAPVTMYDWDRRYFEKKSLVLSLADE